MREEERRQIQRRRERGTRQRNERPTILRMFPLDSLGCPSMNLDDGDLFEDWGSRMRLRVQRSENPEREICVCVKRERRTERREEEKC